MDIAKLFERVQAERDHEALMCVAYCSRSLWDFAAEHARKARQLDEKLNAILEGRGSDYGIKVDGS